MAMDHPRSEELRLALPVTLGKVNAVVAKKDEWTAAELNERTVQFGPVAFTYRDIVSFSEVRDGLTISSNLLPASCQPRG
jgi:hypothetical protein